jgi:glycosyltransferase involved in cell wall biosynthesis
MASKQHKLFYGSSYDRGLDILLKMWSKVLEKYPDATLDICYGWDLFLKGYANNPERMNWLERMNKLMEQKGITHHGRVGKKELAKIRQSCGVWTYPSYFAEINCITALDAQSDGLIPVTMNDFALKETVGSGIKIDGDIYDPETQEAYLAALLDVMGWSEAKFEAESRKAKEFAKGYDWKLIAGRWLDEFKA